jgi:hypothetical protein
MGTYIILLIIAIILTCVFIGVIAQGDFRNDSTIATIVMCGLFAMAAWSGFFYGVGVKHGSYETAKGHYKTLYLYDKDGNVTDTIAEFPCS